VLDGVRLMHAPPFIRCSARAGFADIIAGCAATFGPDGADPLQAARRLQDVVDGEQMPVMLIDDAENLDDAALRAIAALAMLRSGNRPLLSAVLTGAPELAGRLAELLVGDERVPDSRVIALAPMPRAEVERLIRHRLRLAGRSDTDLLPLISDLAVQSNGVPLQVLGLCRRALPAALPAAMPSQSTASSAPVVPPAAAAAALEASLPSETAAEALTAPAQPLPGAPSMAATEPPAGRAGISIPEPAAGHIRYGAESAQHIESARWRRDAPRRRRRGGRALAAAGVAALALATGWMLYDRTPQRLAEISTAGAPAVAPPETAPLRPPVPSSPVAPSPVASSPVAPSSSAAMRAPGIDAAPSPAEAWWRPSGGDAPAAVPPPASGGDRRQPTAAARPAEATPEPVARSPVANPAPVTPPQQAARPTVAKAEPASPPVTAKPRPPAAVVPAAKPVVAGPVPTPAQERADGADETKPPVRSRESAAALLRAGDEQLVAGEIQAARAAYQEAFERGSAEAARRLAQTFDPRNVSAHSSEGSAAEAILWYKDAARRGDRRARGELQGLETWLEDAAASGDGEARRVLHAWRAPEEADAPEGTSQTEP
ncbi:MAG TPA: hypothetical protein VES39_09765, partial [Rhodospirillales bacterium]|nr:hypothetical protein [Rhodospirillales bacterium]